MFGVDTHFHEVPQPGRTVLIVEDEDVSRRALAALLAGNGFRPVAVATAEEALNVLSQGTYPEIALIDLDLPGMSGQELLRRIDKMKRGMNMIIISAAEYDRVLAVSQEGNIPFLRKPLDYNLLIQWMA
jgi:DNA-binding NtrC family response regulator